MDQQPQTIAANDGGGAVRWERAGRAVYRRSKAIALLPVLVCLVTAAIVFPMPDRFEAAAVVQIDPRQKLTPTQPMPDAVETGADLHSIDNEIETLMSEPIARRVIAEQALADDAELATWRPLQMIRRLFGFAPTRLSDTVSAFHDRLAVTRIRNTLLLDVRFSSRDPAKAARIANAVAAAYIKGQIEAKGHLASAALMAARSSGISGIAALATGVPAKATPSERVFEKLLIQYGQGIELGARILGRAVPPRSPAGPSRKQLVAIAGASGLAVAAFLALLLELRAAGGATSQNVQRALSCARMTTIPALPANDEALTPARAARLVLAEPSGHYAQAVRNASGELDRRRNGTAPRIVLVVSALPGEGAELFASNLAHHLAMSGQSPLLVDGDFRMKALTRQLAGHSTRGLLDQIAMHGPVEDAILRDGFTGLHFLPASGPAPIPLSVSSALRSAAFTHAIGTLKERFDTVIVSAPPLLPVRDARVLANLADHIVFVTAWQRTPQHLAKKALSSLGENEAKVAGAVLTDVDDEAQFSIMSFAEIFEEIRRAARLGTFAGSSTGTERAA